MSGVFFFGAVIGYALLVMWLLPRLKAGQALLVSVCGMLFTSFYLVIVLQWMRPAAYLLMYGGLTALAAMIVLLCFHGRRNASLRKRLSSVGFCFFIAICAVFVLLTPNHLLADHDSLSYWARAPKELFSFDRFYIHGDATMFHMDYIPLLAALQYCVVRTFGWRDVYLCYVTFACIAASIAAMVDLSSRRAFVRILTALLLFYAFGVLGQSFLAIRADAPMLCIFSAGLICLFLREDNSASELLSTICSCAVLLGFKIYSGLMFALVLALGLLIEWRCAAKRKEPLGSLRTAFFVSVCLIALMQLSWSGTFHYASALAAYQSAAANAAYFQEPFFGTRPLFQAAYLFEGNARTAQLRSVFTPENLARLSELSFATWNAYIRSKLVWSWLFLLPPLLLCGRAERSDRVRCLRMMFILLLSVLIYTLGLLGSYLVQAETSGDAVRYLSTAMTPIILVGVCLTARLIKRPVSYTWLAIATVGLFLIQPPVQSLSVFTQTQLEGDERLAIDFYQTEIEGQLSLDDSGKRTLLIDCSWDASEIRSVSFKTHAYAYYGLPLRVSVVQWPYGDYSVLEDLSETELLSMLISNRSELLILRVEDELYWDAVREWLPLDDDAESCAVYDVSYQNGELILVCRTNAEN